MLIPREGSLLLAASGSLRIVCEPIAVNLAWNLIFRINRLYPRRAGRVSSGWWISRGYPSVHLPRPIRLTLKNAHQLAGGPDRLATRARTHGVVVRPPLVGMVAENL